MLASAKFGDVPPDPMRLKALSGALALAEGRNDFAYAVLAELHREAPSDCRVGAGAGTAAARLGNAHAAIGLLEDATRQCPGSWESWNALGIAHDLERDWASSGRAYAKALALDPGNARILNNYGYSLFLQHQYEAAVDLFHKAADIDPHNLRIANNLDIALASLGSELAPAGANIDPDRLAERLNNAGYAAYLAGDKRAARAYLSRSIMMRPTYFEKAASNLALAEGMKE